MKILHVGKFYSPIEGGIESINRFIVDSLKGHSQRVLSFNTINKSTDEDIDNIPVLRSATLGYFEKQPLSVRYFWDLRRLIKYYDPDIIHFHYPNPLAVLFLLVLIPPKTKLVVHWHSDIIAQKKLRFIISPLEKKLLRRADRIIATSENYRDNSLSLNNFLEKVDIIPCSIDESNFNLSEENIPKLLEIKKRYFNKPIVFFVGRHVEYKGIRYLLEAEQYVKEDCVFLIGGSGPLTKSLKQKFKSSRIHWLGRIADDEMKLYYHAADIFAFPSITKNEAFGVVLAEAMYCNSPAVTFTVKGSGVNWVAPNEIAAIEVENSNSEAYAAAIDRLLKDQLLRKTLGKNGRERTVNLYSRNVVEKKYRELYENLQ